jgi:transcriptional regulator with XRE-family HTH domain
MKRGRILQPEQPDSANPPPGRGLDLFGQLGGGLNGALENPVQMGIVRTNLSGKSHDVGDKVSKVGSHEGSVGLKHIGCKKNIYMIFPHSLDNRGMDTWTHRTQFKTLASAYRKTKGITLDQFAVELGLKRDTLNGYLYGKVGKPSLEVLQVAASLFGCSLLEFVDDPGDESAELLLSEAKRLVGRLIFKDLAKADVSDEEALAMLKAWQAMKALKDAGGK